jgi:prevent-host-death family protein
MQTVTFTEFRNKASGLVTAAERGETVLVSRHGRVVAVLGPVETGCKTPSWRRSALRLSVKGEGLSAAILEERDDAAVL